MTDAGDKRADNSLGKVCYLRLLCLHIYIFIHRLGRRKHHANKTLLMFTKLVTWRKLTEMNSTDLPTGTLKMRDMKLRDMKMRHHVAGVENARHEFAAPLHF